MKTIIIIKYSVLSTFAFLLNPIYEGGFGKNERMAKDVKATYQLDN